MFSELEHVVMSGMMSSMIGWAIQQGKAMEAQEEREEVVAIIESTRSLPRKEHAELGPSPVLLKKVYIYLAIFIPSCVHDILTQFGISKGGDSLATPKKHLCYYKRNTRT